MVGQLTLDQHIGVRIPGGQDHKLLIINILHTYVGKKSSNPCSGLLEAPLSQQAHPFDEALNDESDSILQEIHGIGIRMRGLGGRIAEPYFDSKGYLPEQL
jgi:hypothetical protein